MNTIEKKIQEDLVKSMKDRNKDMENALKEIKKVIMEYKTAPNGNRDPEDSDLMKVLQKVAKKGKENGEMYARLGKNELAASEYAEYEAASKYLPKMLSEEEVNQIVEDTIKNLNATTIKDMGKVMGFINKTYAGQVDGLMVSKVVKSKLS